MSTSLVLSFLFRETSEFLAFAAVAASPNICLVKGFDPNRGCTVSSFFSQFYLLLDNLASYSTNDFFFHVLYQLFVSRFLEFEIIFPSIFFCLLNCVNFYVHNNLTVLLYFIVYKIISRNTVGDEQSRAGRKIS